MDCIKSLSKWQKLSIANTEAARVSCAAGDFAEDNVGVFKELAATVVW
jgi:hypothetical protein